MNKKLLNIILILSFGFFGLVALVYQVVFAKNLILLFGLTAPAIATVLAVYFLGLSLGSIIFGKLLDKIDYAKRYGFYVLCLIGAGIYGFFVPWLFSALYTIIKWINGFYALDFSGFNFFAFVLAFIFLVIPSVFIGASFPAVSKLLIDSKEKLGQKVSLLYFINTLGSVLGAFLAGFWLIPVLGVKLSLFLAAGFSLLLALIVFLVRPKVSLEKEVIEEKQVFSNKLFLYVLFITGFLALALEVFYTKALILFLGSSTYAFSLILVFFLLGIALGSLVISLFIDSIKRGYLSFGLICGFLGFWLFITLKLFEKLPFWYLAIFKHFESFDFSVVALAQAIVLFFIIFPTTFAMGMLFPLGIKLSGMSKDKIGEGMGKLYFINTLGGVMGSLFAGFFFLSNFGFQNSLVFVLSFYILLSLFFLLKEKNMKSLKKNLLIAFLIIIYFASAFARPWSREVLSMGIFFGMPEYLEMTEKEIRRSWQEHEILYYKEGLSQVMVAQKNDSIWLSVNGKIEASNGNDLETEILSGLLPLMLHKNPQDLLTIGLGSGITLGAMTQFDIAQSIEVVEIDPKVIEASYYFKDWNNNALEDERVKVISADARNYLFLNDKEYDVIVSTPSNPWISGNSYLFTEEFYNLINSRLKEDGIMFQWIQYYTFWPNDLEVVLKTFQSVFPETYLFGSVLTNDLLLVGAKSNDSILEFDEIEKRFEDEKIKQELARIDVKNANELIARFVGSSRAIVEKTADSIVHTDNRPFLEFSAPKALYEKTSLDNLKVLLSLRELENEKPKFFGSNDKTYDFFENWLLSQIYILENDLDKALIVTQRAYDTGVKHNLLTQNLINLYLIQIYVLETEGDFDGALKIRQILENIK